MPFSPSFHDVASLAVDGTTSIIVEAERRFGPIGRKLSRQEQEDLHQIHTLFSELLSQLFDRNHQPLLTYGVANGRARARDPQRY